MSAKNHSSCSSECQRRCYSLQHTAILFVVLLIVEAILNIPAVQKFAGQNLQLTPSDLIFIPVGSFLFFVFWKLMEKAVFDPYLALHVAREAATTGSMEEAEAKKAEAVRLQNQLDQQIAQARGEAVQAKMLSVNQAKKESAAILAEAELLALANSEKAIKEAEARIFELKKDLELKAQELASQVVDKLKIAPDALGK